MSFFIVSLKLIHWLYTTSTVQALAEDSRGYPSQSIGMNGHSFPLKVAALLTCKPLQSGRPQFTGKNYLEQFRAVCSARKANVSSGFSPYSFVSGQQFRLQPKRTRARSWLHTVKTKWLLVTNQRGTGHIFAASTPIIVKKLDWEGTQWGQGWRNKLSITPL